MPREGLVCAGIKHIINSCGLNEHTGATEAVHDNDENTAESMPNPSTIPANDDSPMQSQDQSSSADSSMDRESTAYGVDAVAAATVRQSAGMDITSAGELAALRHRVAQEISGRDRPVAPLANSRRPKLATEVGSKPVGADLGPGKAYYKTSTLPQTPKLIRSVSMPPAQRCHLTIEIIDH